MKICAQKEVKGILPGPVEKVVADVSCCGIVKIIEHAHFRPISCAGKVGLQRARAEGIVRTLIDIWRHEGFMPDGRSRNYNGRVRTIIGGLKKGIMDLNLF